MSPDIGPDNNQENILNQIPDESDFTRRITRPLPDTLPLKSDLPIEIVDLEPAHINEIYKERIRQAKLSFNCALPLGIAGILVLLVGAFFWEHDRGKASVGAGIIMDAVSFFLMKFHGETNRRLDETMRASRNAKRVDRAFRRALAITDPKMRNETIAQLAKTSVKNEDK